MPPLSPPRGSSGYHGGIPTKKSHIRPRGEAAILAGGTGSALELALGQEVLLPHRRLLQPLFSHGRELLAAKLLSEDNCHVDFPLIHAYGLGSSRLLACWFVHLGSSENEPTAAAQGICPELGVGEERVRY